LLLWDFRSKDMPELPDVERFKQLVEGLLKRRITQVEVVKRPGYKVRVLQNVSEEKLRQKIVGTRLVKLKRRGKFLLAYLSNNFTLIFHFMLSAEPVVTGLEEMTEKVEKYRRFFIDFDNKYRLWFIDRRNLGKVFLIKDEQFEEVGALAEMGVEPLAGQFSFPVFESIIATHPRLTIKELLVRQNLIAGIGNIYSDEILFRAKIRPTRQVFSLNFAEKRLLYSSIISTLKEGVDKLLRSQPLRIGHWRKRGETCPVCGGKIFALKRGSSHTYFCQKHQI
jgi:formamidopyrimidine-DNA glycosylase